MWPKKNRLGMKEKPRPMPELEAEYGRLASLVGHKSRLARELYAEAEEHLDEMSQLSKESAAAKAEEDLAKIKEGPAVNHPASQSNPIQDPPAPQGPT